MSSRALIIAGPNGSGKTTFAGKVPASRDHQLPECRRMGREPRSSRSRHDSHRGGQTLPRGTRRSLEAGLQWGTPPVRFAATGDRDGTKVHVQALFREFRRLAGRKSDEERIPESRDTCDGGRDRANLEARRPSCPRGEPVSWGRERVRARGRVIRYRVTRTLSMRGSLLTAVLTPCLQYRRSVLRDEPPDPVEFPCGESVKAVVVLVTVSRTALLPRWQTATASHDGKQGA